MRFNIPASPLRPSGCARFCRFACAYYLEVPPLSASLHASDGRDTFDRENSLLSLSLFFFFFFFFFFLFFFFFPPHVRTRNYVGENCPRTLPVKLESELRNNLFKDIASEKSRGESASDPRNESRN